jgi:hypothetical protein
MRISFYFTASLTMHIALYQFYALSSFWLRLAQLVLVELINLSNMKFLILCALIGCSSAFFHCNNPAASRGRFLGPTQECAALVQSQCAGVGLTGIWRKGLHVKESCAQIPAFTAIATFLGAGGRYDTPGENR